ncbi:MAG: hypothetical protein HYS77_05670 [Candidatus Rokubacteria bacterium]|nr:hypothetical protein [Candidatus Rokubacteria bacterium]
MTAMRLGVLVPTRGVVMRSARRPAVEECWTMARLADRAGCGWGRPCCCRRCATRPSSLTRSPAWTTEAGPPVLITAGNRGELLPAQLDRFARLGDGIITTYAHAEECRLLRERAGEAAAFLAAYYGGGVPSRGTMGLGPADAVIGALGRYAEAGVTDLCLRFVGDDQLAQMERFTAEVLPSLRVDSP